MAAVGLVLDKNVVTNFGANGVVSPFLSKYSLTNGAAVVQAEPVTTAQLAHAVLTTLPTTEATNALSEVET